MHAGTTIGRRFTLLHTLAYDLAGVERWVAEDTRLAQRVNLDFLSGADAEEARRVAALTAKIRDARFPRIMSSGVHIDDDGRHTYIVSERPRGTNAATILATGPLTPAAAATLVGEAARALTVASDAGVHHGDLRPEALTVTPAGRVLVTGLGVDGVLARAGSTGPLPATAPDEATDAAALTRLYALAVTGIAAHDLTASQVPDGLGSAGTALIHAAIADDAPTRLADLSRAMGVADARALRTAASASRAGAPAAATPASDLTPADVAAPGNDAPEAPSGPTPDLDQAAGTVIASPSPEDIDAPDAQAVETAREAAEEALAGHLLADPMGVDRLLAEVTVDPEAPVAGHAKDAPLEMLEEIVEEQEAHRSGSIWQLLLERLHGWWPGAEPITAALDRARERARRPAPFNAGPLVLGVSIVAIIVVAIVAFSQLTTVTVPDDYEPGPTTHEYPSFTLSPSPEPSASNDG